MSEDLFGTNRLIVQALSPVHIGSGEKLASVSYIVTGQQVIVLDENKLLRWIAEDGSGRRAANISPKLAQGESLRPFIEQERKDPRELAAYMLPLSGNLPRGKEILAFIKETGVNGTQVYLPGSSLKGSLRSALLRGAILDNPALRAGFEKEIERGSRERNAKTHSDDIQAQVFSAGAPKESRRPNYDLNRVLLLADSPGRAPAEVLEVVEIKVFTKHGNSLLPKKTKNGSDIAVYAETLKPKTSFTLEARWQTHLLAQSGAASELKFADQQRLLLYLPEFCRAASLQLMAQEIKFYRANGFKNVAEWYEARQKLVLENAEVGKFALPLGWGSGYDAKTITDLLSTATFKIVSESYKNTSGLGRPGNSRGGAWLGPVNTPKSRKLVVRRDKHDHETYEPLGWVSLNFEEGSVSDPGWYTQARQAHASARPVIELKSAAPTPAPASAPAEKPVAARAQPLAEKPVATQAQPLAEKPVAAATPQEAAPAAIPITQKFSAAPQPGDRFYGVVFDVSDGTAYLKIPGLDSNDIYAAIAPEDNPNGKSWRSKQKVLCTVISAAPDPQVKGCTLVRCRAE